jgi:hypothetical protein
MVTFILCTKNRWFVHFMITYAIKTTECLQALLHHVTNLKSRYWMSSTISIDRVNVVLPKLIEKYKLDLDFNERRNTRKRGEPVWSMVVTYNPREPEYLSFWLLTTGYHESKYASADLLSNVSKLNKELIYSENLKPIITSNKHELLTFGNYVLGQYVLFDDLKNENNKLHIDPYMYGLPLEPIFFKTTKKNDLVIRSRNGSSETIKIGMNLSKDDEAKYQENLGRYGDFLLKNEHQEGSMDFDQIKSKLNKIFGIIPDENATYQDCYRLLKIKLTKRNNTLSNIFQRKSNKRLVFTWYFNDKALEQIQSEVSYRYRHIVRRPEKFEEFMVRLFRKGNFHGVRYQIGTMSAKIKLVIKLKYPNIYKKLKFPSKLSYVRFIESRYRNFKEFHIGCIASSIILEKQIKLDEMEKSKLRSMRIYIRKTNPDLAMVDTNILNDLILEVDNQNTREIEVTENDIADFLTRHSKMSLVYISGTY